ncbi:transmembrane 4 L6 family member 1 isoform X2 [Mustelus asterias]
MPNDSKLLLKGLWTTMIFPIVVFIGLDEDCYSCCGNRICGKSSSMLASLIVALIGMAGGVYCFSVSALGLSQGPYCLTDLGWCNPFNTTNGRYLTNYTTWSQCSEPSHIVAWNVTLFSILLVLSGIEIILCFIQFVNGLVGANCCCNQESRECSEIEVYEYEAKGSKNDETV